MQPDIDFFWALLRPHPLKCEGSSDAWVSNCAYKLGCCFTHLWLPSDLFCHPFSVEDLWSPTLVCWMKWETVLRSWQLKTAQGGNAMCRKVLSFWKTRCDVKRGRTAQTLSGKIPKYNDRQAACLPGRHWKMVPYWRSSQSTVLLETHPGSTALIGYSEKCDGTWSLSVL